LQKFSGKQNKVKLVVVRRVVGSSMSPKLIPGQLVIASSRYRKIRPGEVFIFRHDGKEKIKRAERTELDRVFFIGDNLAYSSDSRHFGWVGQTQIIAKVIWPRVHN
jgi:phage repressor protein C with HTH and peptisase S24 domain